jgi:LuxR family maltose regulon positive regulatory protein
VREVAQRSRVVLIAGPAGYGKSTLAAEWAELDPRATCWEHLGRRDNDPVVLLSHLATAIATVGPALEELLEELSRQGPRIDDIALPLLAASLGERNPFVLVVDDAHVLTAPKSLAVLSLLIDEVPVGSQLMLVTRGDPAVPLGRVRASRELVEIGTELLTLDAAETRAVAASGGLALSEQAAETLCERTEGWAAGVVLAALSLRGTEGAEERVAGMAGDQTAIADYLVEEVLRNQSDHLTTFLLGTSILERMTAPLCNAVLDVHDAADSLEALARSNAFVLPLDDHREWYRYHNLFGNLLRTELNRRHPERLCTYLVRAARWCEVYGRADEAFAYARDGGDLALAGRVALANWYVFTQRGQSETLRLWFDRCTDEEIASDPQLSIAAGWVFMFRGDAVRARRFVAAAERGGLDVASADGATSLRSALAYLRATLVPDGISQMLRDAEFVYASEKQSGSRWHLSAARAIGMAYVLLGRPQEAIVPLREVVASQQPELAAVRVVSLGYLAFAASQLGRRKDANRWAVQATRLVQEERLAGTAFSAFAHTAAALTNLERGDDAAAARNLENVRHLRPLIRAIWCADADLALRCAHLSLDLGDRPGAVEFAEVADDALSGRPDAGALPARLQTLKERLRLGRDYELTAAELRIIGFLPTHLSLQEIADRLHLSRATIKTHVASIYTKLGVHGRSEAVEAIEQSGLVSWGRAGPPG